MKQRWVFGVFSAFSVFSLFVSISMISGAARAAEKELKTTIVSATVYGREARSFAAGRSSFSRGA